jgi:hypothetical protein
MDHDAHTPPRKRSRLTTRNVYIAGICLAIAPAILRGYGLSVADLARLAREKVAEAVADAKAITTREAGDRYARRLREEAAAIPVDVPMVTGKESVEISRDIQAERKRILEERAEHLKLVGQGVLSGDLESVKKKVDENARRAGGDH